MHKVILNMLVTKDLDKKSFDYIDPLGENTAYISWAIRALITVLLIPHHTKLYLAET